MSWRPLKEEEMIIGKDVVIANQQHIGNSKYTPLWANNQTGRILRVNSKSLTIDLCDGNIPIRCDPDHVGINV